MIFKDEKGMFRIESVASRVGIVQKYWGLQGDKLNKAAGIDDGEFVHADGFSGGAWSLKSCIKIVDDSI